MSVANLWYAAPEEQGLPPDDQRKRSSSSSLYEHTRKQPLDPDAEQLPPMEVLMTVARLRDVYRAQQQEEHSVGFTTSAPRARTRFEQSF